MKATENCLKQIKNYFQNAVNLQQSCKILIATSQGDSWSFYFKKVVLFGQVVAVIDLEDYIV